LPPINASSWGQAAASVPGSGLAAALADSETLVAEAVVADDADDAVDEVDEPPQPDSDRARAAAAIGATKGMVIILDMLRSSDRVCSAQRNPR
jgi:hypothetical protein